MLRLKCSYKEEGIETCKKPKSKKEIRLKFAIYQKQGKTKFPAENIYM